MAQLVKPHNIRIALISRSEAKFSETFISEQIKRLPGKVFHYFGNSGNLSIAGHGALFSRTKLAVLAAIYKIIGLSIHDAKMSFLVRSLHRNKIDVALVHFGNVAAMLLDALRKSKTPFIVIFHGYDASRKDILKEHDLDYKLIFKEAASIIAVSKTMCQSLIDLGCSQQKIHHIACPASDKFLGISPNYQNKRALSIGRFVDKKAPYHTILAFSEALRSHPEAILTYYGDGPLHNMAKNLVRYLRLEANIKLPGRITPAEYLIECSQARLYIQHSIVAENGDSEGTPVAIQEASAAALPVVSTLHAGIPDVVIHGETGLLSEEHDVSTMASHISQILDDMQLTERLGSAGRNNIKNNHSMQSHIEKTSDLLLLAARSRLLNN